MLQESPRRSTIQAMRLCWWRGIAAILLASSSESFCGDPQPLLFPGREQQQLRSMIRFPSSVATDTRRSKRWNRSPVLPATAATTDDEPEISAAASPPGILSVDDALEGRYACTRFHRFAEASGMPLGKEVSNDETTETTPTGSVSDPSVVSLAKEALELARRAPTGFNLQPFKLFMVQDPKAKEALARSCLGRNADRIRDSDCTVLFLADREALRELPSYRRLVKQRRKRQGKESTGSLEPRRKSWSARMASLKIQFLVGLFSSGLPLPHWISGPFSALARFAMRILSWFGRKRFPLPTLSNAETWSQRNTMLVAMSYLLACTARGLATCPMEGYTTWCVRQTFGIPRRYTIPLMVSTGIPYQDGLSSSASDDAGITHGTTNSTKTPRYPAQEVVFTDVFDPKPTLKIEEDE